MYQQENIDLAKKLFHSFYLQNTSWMIWWTVSFDAYIHYSYRAIVHALRVFIEKNTNSISIGQMVRKQEKFLGIEW